MASMMSNALEVLQIPFHRAAPLWADESTASQPAESSSAFILACLQHKAPESKTCTLYLHGFPDQSVDHRAECPALYGKFSGRLPKKLAESIPNLCALNFSGSPGSDSGLAFYDKTVSQEVFDVLTAMRHLQCAKGFTSFHVVGLSTGAIIGALLRRAELLFKNSSDGDSPEAPPRILSISILAACGADIDEALCFDFDEQQRADFEQKGACTKEFWLPRGAKSNPKAAHEVRAEGDEEAVAAAAPGRPGATASHENAPEPEELPQDENTPFVRHALQLGSQYKTDFLQLPVRACVAEGAIPLLVVHGAEDKNVSIESGRALFAAAAEPKQWLEIAKGNHLLTNSKDLKKAISEIGRWHERWAAEA